MYRHIQPTIAVIVLSGGCGSDPAANPTTTDSTDSGGSSSFATAAGTSAGSVDTTASDEDDDSGIKLDVHSPAVTTAADTGSDTETIDLCHVVDDMNAVGDCELEAPSDSFVPDVQWAFAGESDENQAVVTPLVANMTDDNGDGSIDLCDVPDVVVPLYGAKPGQSDGHTYLLDGETGEVNLRIDEVVDAYANPAIGDIDGDGQPEIVAIRREQESAADGHVIALDHDGSLLWESATVFYAHQAAISLADLDTDGDVEILAGRLVLDHLGVLEWAAGPSLALEIPVAADLDGDGDLEVLQGGNAFHHDGTPYYTTYAGSGHVQVANLDDDPQPEVVVVGLNGISLLQHDGQVEYLVENPTGDDLWWRPAAIHDIDGDDRPEILVSSDSHYNAFTPELDVVWSTFVSDFSGYASGTAFDFLGSGIAQAIYADEDSLFVYGEAGDLLMMTPRQSWTQVENPVVADVDNDGSAEIVVVSNGGAMAPVQVIRDVDERWIQARRIWNQHAYHVTNVREDGTIPQYQTPSWETLNTFRTNAQIESGLVCEPQPRG